MFYEVIPEGMVEALTYDYDGSLSSGQIVIVPVGKRVVPGIVVKKVVRPNFRTKSIIKVLYSKPLPKHLLDTVRFVHDYYLAPIGSAVSLVLPRGVEKKRRKTEQMFGKTVFSMESDETFSSGPCPTDLSPQAAGTNSRATALRSAPSPECPHQSSLKGSIPLNAAQKHALEGLLRAPGATKLLFGVTGSGKTNIYLKMAFKALSGQKSVILLVPEIALTGQLVNVFKERFGDRIVLIHSKQTEAERHLIFDSILGSSHPIIVIGPRSALFAPLSNLGLIIIDEEHESSYYQENSPKYSTVRVASFIANRVDCPLLLGSATPTIDDYYLASRQGSVVHLEEKAKASALKPDIRIVDFKDRDSFSKNKYFSNALLKSIASDLELGRQTLIFHNRRGSSPLTICEKCGEEILCPNCYLPLNLHADEYMLHCHTCGFHMKVPMGCPKCGEPELIHKGFGTKLLESELRKLFPKARMQRFDADNKKGEGMDSLYNAVRDGEIDILVGTQTITKGLDLPKLATVGVVQADAGLSLPDYMAEERTFQLITQVIGRVGRGHINKAEVFIQTYRPDHPILKFAASEDYLGFYDYLIKRRRRSGFPPFKFVAKLEITMKTESVVLKKIRELTTALEKNPSLILSPPMPAFHERTNKGYTWQIILRSRSRKSLVNACTGIDRNFKITLDPPGLI